MKVKQVIIIRKDLKMNKGRMVAQGAHASIAVILDEMDSWFDCVSGQESKHLKLNNELEPWINKSFVKVCLGVDSEIELLDILNKAKDARLRTSLICDDIGIGERVNTCIAIGPNFSDKIDKIVGHLKLL